MFSGYGNQELVGTLFRCSLVDQIEVRVQLTSAEPEMKM